MQPLKTTYLSLGSNQGNRLNNLQKAIYMVDATIGVVQKIASVFKTASWGFKSAYFYNTCIEVKTTLPPNEVLLKLQDIEKQLGRNKTLDTGYEARPIDIDILLFDNEIIFSKTLIVPHKEMLKRKFVMVPLAEIAPNLIHPIAHKQLSICAKACVDSSAIEKTTLKLTKPMAIASKYNYIAIEGNIGVGKTTLSKMISEQFNAKVILERFAENPFLPKYYNNMERFAFSLEMSFLADRYQQLSDDLGQFDLFKSLIVSDYYIFKSLIFAQISLAKEEYMLYRRVFDIMYKEITKPDLYIYLYQNTPRLLENIKKRGRAYEQNITAAYLDKIHSGYVGFIKTQSNLNSLIIDVSDKDFVNNPLDYKEIVNAIKRA